MIFTWSYTLYRQFFSYGLFLIHKMHNIDTNKRLECSTSNQGFSSCLRIICVIKLKLSLNAMLYAIACPVGWRIKKYQWHYVHIVNTIIRMHWVAEHALYNTTMLCVTAGHTAFNSSRSLKGNADTNRFGEVV